MVGGAIGHGAFVAEALLDLLGEVLEDLIEEGAYGVGQSCSADGLATHEAGEEYGEDFVETFEYDLLAGEVSAVDVIHSALVDVGIEGLTDNFGELPAG